jgi:hypothetical protein
MLWVVKVGGEAKPCLAKPLYQCLSLLAGVLKTALEGAHKLFLVRLAESHPV